MNTEQQSTDFIKMSVELIDASLKILAKHLRSSGQQLDMMASVVGLFAQGAQQAASLAAGQVDAHQFLQVAGVSGAVAIEPLGQRLFGVAQQGAEAVHLVPTAAAVAALARQAAEFLFLVLALGAFAVAFFCRDALGRG